MATPPNVSKVQIRPFKDKKFQSSAGPPFSLPINPEQLGQLMKIGHDNSQGQGIQGNSPKYAGTRTPEVKLEFIFDSTGAIMGNTANDKPVGRQVQDFLKVVYFMEGEIHKPKYLMLIWGEYYVFHCVLSNVDVQYTLFDREGTPIRAKISATFIEFKEDDIRVREERKSSPDLTHYRTFGAEDDLPLLTYQVYADKKFYVQVAKANGLTSFRNIDSGSSLIFPPIDRPET